MPKFRFLLVTFDFEGEDAPYDELVEAFDKALDWVRYAPNCFILRTSNDYNEWFKRVRKRISPEASVFIVEFNPARRVGYLPKRVWDWLDKQPKLTD